MKENEQVGGKRPIFSLKRQTLPKPPIIGWLKGLVLIRLKCPKTDYKTDIIERMNSLHHSPDNTQTAHFCGEGVNLIGASTHIAKEAFNRIGTANMVMHRLWEGIKGQEMPLIFA